MADNKYDLFSELGQTGLNQWGGYVQEEFLDKLLAERGKKIYREMSDNDDVIGAILYALKMLVRKVDWFDEPASEDAEDIDAAQFLKECREDTSGTWTDGLVEILSFLVYGFSVLETVYKVRAGEKSSGDKLPSSNYEDGKIGWRKLAGRAQSTIDRWDIDENGGIRGCWQIAPPKFLEVYLPIDKLLLFRTEATKNDPQGRSILRNAYRAWFFKKRIQTVEGIGIERDLAGLPVAYAPPEIMQSTASSEQKATFAELKKIVTRIRRDEQEGIIFPLAYDEMGRELFKLTLLSTGGARQFNTSEVIVRYDQRMAMTVLADFILLGHEKVGSFALSNSKTDIFGLALSAFLDAIADVFNRYAIPRLFAVNGYALDNLPKLKHGKIESVALQEVLETIKTFAASGAPLFPDDTLENHVRGLAGLPRKEEGK